MATIQVRRLVDPTPEELDRAAATAVAAFQGDQSSKVLFEGNWAYASPYMRSEVAAAAIGGEVWIASHDGMDIAGVAAWFPPGRYLGDTKEQVEAGRGAFMASLSPEHRAWWNDDFVPKWVELCNNALGEGTTTASWYLGLLAVHPDHQKLGIGRTLFETVAVKATAEDKLVTLGATKDENVALYQSWGCILKGSKEICGKAGTFTSNVLVKNP